MSGEYWLSDCTWASIEALLPKNQPGARRVDDRRVISGIIHGLHSGCRCAGLSFGPWPADHDLQSLRPLAPEEALAEDF